MNQMTASLTCLHCRAGIPTADTNVTEGVAICRSCGMLNRLTDILTNAELQDVSINVPPSGCIMLDDGQQTTVRASTRSVSGALTLLGVAAFWNGGISIFVAQAMSVTYRHLNGHNAPWLTAPNWSGYPNGLPPVWFAVGLWVFLIPLIAIGLYLVFALLLAMFGRVEVRIRDNFGVVFVGCGRLGWSRVFNLSDLKIVKLGAPRWQNESQSLRAIVIECDRKIRFGSTLPDERRVWMAAVLRRLLMAQT